MSNEATPVVGFLSFALKIEMAVLEVTMRISYCPGDIFNCKRRSINKTTVGISPFGLTLQGAVTKLLSDRGLCCPLKTGTYMKKKRKKAGTSYIGLSTNTVGTMSYFKCSFFRFILFSLAS